MLLRFSILFFIFQLDFLQAAPCCGGVVSMPTVIAGPEESQLSVSLSTTRIVVANVDSEGIWRRSSEQQKIQTWKIGGAHVIGAASQIGFSVPVMTREFAGNSFSGLGDISLSYSQEYLSEWNQTTFLPKGVGFFQVKVPTGKSRAESDRGGLDSLGTGFWALGVGTILTKSWGAWDFVSVWEAHRSFGKRFSNQQFQGTIQPGFGGFVDLGFGFNWSQCRMGFSASENFEDPVDLDLASGARQDGRPERYSTATASLSFLQNDEWNWTLTYSDQTVLGNPANTSLGQSIMLQTQKRWAR